MPRPMVLLALLVLWATGCSYAFVHGPPAPIDSAPASAQEDSKGRVTCTTSNDVPILDTVLGVTLVGVGGAGVVVAVASSHCSGPCDAPNAWGDVLIPSAVMVAVGAVALASAITGYGRTADCRRTVETLPSGPRQGARHLLDLDAIAAARAREEREQF